MSRPDPAQRELRPPEIAKLAHHERAILDALISCWLTETPTGRALLTHADPQTVTAAIYDNVDAGLMRMLCRPGPLSADPDASFGFAIELTPSGWAQLCGGGSA